MKTASINVRVESSVKEEAEEILEKLGISTAAFINMTLKQVIMHKGIPYDLTIPENKITTRDTMSDTEFNQMIQNSLEEAKKGDSVPYEKAFDSLMSGL